MESRLVQGAPDDGARHVVPLAFEPGEAFQFDWSEDWAIIGNERTNLAYSRAFVVRAYLLQTHEMLFDAHNVNQHRNLTPV
jgi:hypothetical protein